MTLASRDGSVPVILLKTRSPAGDAYEDLFSAPALDGHHQFAPQFVPVLQHQYEDEGMEKVRAILQDKQISSRDDASFGGLIFTSQRAVEAFTQLVQDGLATGDPSWPHLQGIPVYSVGPATTRALSAVAQTPPLEVLGAHTGNGDALAAFILSDYALGRHAGRARNPALLFLVGDQRRDIIPRTLMDPSLPEHKRIPVEEVVVYGTGVMASFPSDFARVLGETDADGRGVRWVVVFSPTGCDSMLRGLGMLDEVTGKVRPAGRDGRTFIATIGPTTRDYLVKTFGFEPDVCAETPSPEGVLRGIVDFESRRS